MDCREKMDCVDLRIPRVQEEMLASLYETGTPVVVVVFEGRTYVMTEIKNIVRACGIHFTWDPREERQLVK